MKETIPTIELNGKLTVEFQPEKNLESFCVKHIPNYDSSRFEPVAARLFAGKELIITIYALDKLSPKNNDGHLPVKKFKLGNIDPFSFSEFIASVNFTLTMPGYDIDKIKVINK